MKDHYRETGTLVKRSPLVSPEGEAFAAKVRAVVADHARQLQGALAYAKAHGGRYLQGNAGYKQTRLPGGVAVKTWINPFGLTPMLMARVYYPTGGMEEETFCFHNGLYVTNAYGWNAELNSAFIEQWFGRDEGRYIPAWTDEIPACLVPARKQIDISQSWGPIAVENYTEPQAGINFRQSTRFSGAMRKIVQMQAGAGIKIGAAFGFYSTVGAIQTESGGWFVKIAINGVFRQPMRFGAPVNTDCEDPLAKRIPKAIDLAAWEEIADASQVADFYAGTPFSKACGWAFDASGLEARNTRFKSDPTDYYVTKSAMYSITFSLGEDGPVFGGLAKLDEGVLLGEAITGDSPWAGQNIWGNYWFEPEYEFKLTSTDGISPYTNLSDYFTNSGGIQWSGDEQAPIYTWYDLVDNRWRIFKWLSRRRLRLASENTVLPAGTWTGSFYPKLPEGAGTFTTMGSGDRWIAYCGPMFEDDAPPEDDVTGVSQYISYSGTMGSAGELYAVGTTVEQIGTGYRGRGQKVQINGYSKGTTYIGRAALRDRHAMFTSKAKAISYTGGKSGGAGNGVFNDKATTRSRWTPYGGDCETGPDGPVLTKDLDSCGNGTAQIWIADTMKPYETIGGFVEITSAYQGGTPSLCQYNSYTSFVKEEVNPPGGDWDTINWYNACHTGLSCSTTGAGADIERSYGVIADGIAQSYNNEIHVRSVVVLQDWLPPPVCGQLIRDAFNSESAVLYHGWEMLGEAFRWPGFSDEPQWEQVGGNVYTAAINSQYPEPARLSTPGGMRHVFVGKPTAC